LTGEGELLGERLGAGNGTASARFALLPPPQEVTTKANARDAVPIITAILPIKFTSTTLITFKLH